MRSDLVETKLELNRQTKGLIDSFELHRAKVMQLIDATVSDLSGDDAKQCSSIVLLGAGNCLDVDLPKLAEQFQTLDLVDLDQVALRDVVENSKLESKRIKTHAPVDIAEPLLGLTSRDLQCEQENSEHFLNVLQHLSAASAITDVPEADVVVSLCVLSQIFGSLTQLTHENHASFEKIVHAIRIGHLRRMLDLLRKGGVGILITDVVSSDTAPELSSATEEEMPELLKKLLESRNFFSGTNPSTVLADLNILSRLPGGPESVHTIDPWPWQMGDRTYAVYGLRFQKKPPMEESDVPTPENFS